MHKQEKKQFQKADDSAQSLRGCFAGVEWCVVHPLIGTVD